MALCHRAQVVHGLRVRYLLRHHHVDDSELVERNLQKLCQWSGEKLCRHPVQHWQMVVCWLHHLLVPLGPSIPFAPTLVGSNLFYPSSPMRPGKPRKSSPAEISLMLSPTSWLTTTILSVRSFVVFSHFLLMIDRRQVPMTTSVSSTTLATQPRRVTTLRSSSSSPSRVGIPCFMVSPSN